MFYYLHRVAVRILMAQAWVALLFLVPWALPSPSFSYAGLVVRPCTASLSIPCDPSNFKDCKLCPLRLEDDIRRRGTRGCAEDSTRGDSTSLNPDANSQATGDCQCNLNSTQVIQYFFPRGTGWFDPCCATGPVSP